MKGKYTPLQEQEEEEVEEKVESKETLKSFGGGEEGKTK